MRFASLAFGFGLVLACSAPDPDLAEPKALVELGGSCTATMDCAKDLFCASGTCAQPTNQAETKATEVAHLERKIKDTVRYEKKAFTEDGKRRMQKERAELEAKLAALQAG